MSLTRIIVFLLVALLCCSSAQDSLTRISPDENDPFCPETNLVYKCVVTASFLIWRYTSDGGGGTISHNYGDFEMVDGSVYFLGPFELILNDVLMNGSESIITSTANATNGLSPNDNGKEIICLGGNFEKKEKISFSVPTITNGSFCQDEVSWIHQASCHANCTVIVTGQDNETVLCCDEHVRIGGADLNNKTVTIIASDSLGNIVSYPVAPTEDCPEPDTSTIDVFEQTMTNTSPPAASENNTAGIIGATVGIILAVLLALAIILLVTILLVYRRKQSGKYVTCTKYEARSELNKKENGEGNGRSLILEFETTTNNCHEHPITHCTISPDAKCVVTADTSLEVKLWLPNDHNKLVCKEIFNPEKIQTEMSPTDIQTAKIFPDRKLLLSLNWLESDPPKLMLAYDNCVICWDIRKETLIKVFEPERDFFPWTGYTKPSMFCAACTYFDSTPFYALSYTSVLGKTPCMGNLLLKQSTASDDPRDKMLCKNEPPVFSMSFSPNGNKLVTGNTEGIIRIYDISHLDQPCWKSLSCSGTIWEVQFGSDDDKNIYCLVAGERIHLWNTSSNEPPTKIADYASSCLPSLPLQVGNSLHPVTWRNKLFGFFCAYSYILFNSNGPRNVLYQVKPIFAPEAESPLSRKDPFNCLDCVTRDDTTTCVMAPSAPERANNHAVVLFRLRYGCPAEPPSTVADGGEQRCALEEMEVIQPTVEVSSSQRGSEQDLQSTTV